MVHRRTVLLTELTDIAKETTAEECIESLEITLQMVEEARKTFKELQQGIEDQLLKKGDSGVLQAETQMREYFNNEWKKLMVTIRKGMSATQMNEEKTTKVVTEAPKAHSGKVNMTPYDSPRETVSNFLQRLCIYFDIISCQNDHDKVLILLNSLDPKIHRDLCASILPSIPQNKSYEELSSALKCLLEGERNIYVEQHKFISRVQRDTESIQDYYIALKNLTVNCDFKCDCGRLIDEPFLKLQFIRGINDPEIRRKLLQVDYSYTFQKLVKEASAIELAKREEIHMKNSHNFTEAETFNIHKDTYKDKPKQNSNASPKTSRKVIKLRSKCFRCGRSNHDSNSCFYKKSICHKCKQPGHISKCCKSRDKVHEVDLPDDSWDEDEVNCLRVKSSDKMFISLLVDSIPLKMELDTGAAVSTISYEDFRLRFPEKRLFKTNLKLRTYTNEEFSPRGVAYVVVRYRDHEFHSKLYVISAKTSTLLGREWLREMKGWHEDIRTIENKNDYSLDTLLSEFGEIFSESIEPIPNFEAEFQMKDIVNPVFMKARTVPYALRSKVEDEIKRLEKLGIITRTEHSEWGTPVVPRLKKSGQVRLCADYKVTLNKFVMDERYPIPRIEDLFMKMRGGKVFCTLDIHQAYLHMKMTEEAADMQTISTHIGSFKVNRLMFGVKVAPGIWQKFMDSLLFDSDGVACFFDDIIIQGSTYEECYNRLRAVLEKLRANNLSLTKDKCVFFKPSISYLGHVINEHGLLKSNDKIKAIHDAPSPTNQKEVKSFLGLINYYHKFISQLATKASPLNDLLRKYQRFRWTAQCEEAFQSVKREITSDTVLMHFDPDLPVTLATDASPVGLGAVISHKLPDGTERPISFASRSLSKSERNYSQIDKEATAIYWGVKKFYDYLYGRKFILITDHKPLVSILHPNKMLPNITASRLFNYAHFLSGFDYDIVYRNTDTHGNADFLSRFPTEKCNKDIDNASVFQIHQISSLPIKYEDIVHHTEQDPELIKIVHALKDGISLKTLGYEDSQFTLEEGCLLRGLQVVIPQTLRKQVLDELHTAHLGIVKMKALARSYCYWPGIDKEIEQLVRTCSSCRENLNEDAKVDVHPWDLPQGPWQRIHIDFAGPIKGQMIMIVVDAYTKWTELFTTKTTTSTWVIGKLKQLFTCFGIPVTLVSDNGPQFVSIEFEDFLKHQGIAHLTSAPYHPSSNGLAERGVQTMKQSLRKMSEEGGTLDSKLQDFLIQYRRTPHTSTGVSPYESMFGREMRNVLSLMKNTKPQSSNNKRHVKKTFSIGSKVQFRNYQPGPKWIVGKVCKRIGLFLYLIELRNGSSCKRHVNQMRRAYV